MDASKDGAPSLNVFRCLNPPGKRRIDYICLDKTVDVKLEANDVNFRFVTALATLTDHIPMAMTFTLHQ